jgi:hypothetical protein
VIDNVFISAIYIVYTGKYSEAQRLFEDSLAICEELLGAAHPATALCLNNLAGLMQASGQTDVALNMYMQVGGG